MGDGTPAPGGERYQRGLDVLRAFAGEAGPDAVAALGDIGRFAVEFGYGDVYSREGLALRDRAIVTVAVLTALGGREPQLRFHMEAALRNGVSAAELEEVLVQTVPYAGFPAAINALVVLRAITGEAADAGPADPEG